MWTLYYMNAWYSLGFMVTNYLTPRMKLEDMGGYIIKFEFQTSMHQLCICYILQPDWSLLLSEMYKVIYAVNNPD